MPHLVEAFRAVRSRHFLGARDTRQKAWALADDHGFIREMSPAFAAALRSHWPASHGNLLPEVLARCVVEGRVYSAKSLTIELRQSANLWFLEVKGRSPLDKLSARESEIAGHYPKGQGRNLFGNFGDAELVAGHGSQPHFELFQEAGREEQGRTCESAWKQGKFKSHRQPSAALQRHFAIFSIASYAYAASASALFLC